MSTKLGSSSIVCVKLSPQKLPVIQSSRCLLLRGCLSIEMNGSTVGTFGIVHYIVGVCFSGVSVKWGSTVDQIGPEKNTFYAVD